MSIQDLIQAINTQLPDNNQQLITEAILRGVLENMVNTLSSELRVFNINSSQVTNNGDGTYTLASVENELMGALAFDEDLNIYQYNGTHWTLKTSGATAAQGAKADTAIQPGDNISGLNNDSGYLTETTHDALPQDNPHGVTKAQVGLGNVDNTSDADKPVSTAQSQAISQAEADAKQYTDDEINALNLGSASQADVGDFATAAQGAKADSAQSGLVLHYMANGAAQLPQMVDGQRYYNTNTKKILQRRGGSNVALPLNINDTVIYRGVNYTFDGTDLVTSIPDGFEIVQQFNPIRYVIDNDSVVAEYTNLSIRGKRVKVKKGDVVIVKEDLQGSGSIFMAFTDLSNNVVEQFPGKYRDTPLSFICPRDGYICTNYYLGYTEGYLKVITKHLPHNPQIPLNRFVKDLTYRDFTSDISGIDLGGKQFMFDIYSAYDDLVSNYPDFVHKLDLGDELGIAYPSYANGVSSGDPNYLETDPYKTFMYKFSDTVVEFKPEGFTKKKLLLVGCVHGWEQGSSTSAYLLLKRMCENISSDVNLFMLRSYFDIYIIPVLNGYGSVHGMRSNANGVDINRNFPVYGWTEEFDPDNPQYYTGPSGGSEFETQLVMNLVSNQDFDAIIDLHSYGVNPSSRQSWGNAFTIDASRTIFEAYSDASFAAVKNMPEYFGTKYQFIARNDIQVENTSRLGKLSIWAHTKANKNYSLLFETSHNINMLGGVPTSSSGVPTFDPKVFSVSENIVANLLYKLADTILTYPDTVNNYMTP